MKLIKVQRLKTALLTVSSVLISFSLMSKELTFAPIVSADNVLVDYDSDSNNAELNTNTFNLNFLANYQSRKVNFQSNIATEYIFRNAINGNTASNDNAFLQFDSLGKFKLWQDKISLTTQLNRSQQANSQGLNLGNKLVNSSDWFNVNSGSISLDYQSRLTSKAAITSQLKLSKVQADLSQVDTPANAAQINTESTALSTFVVNTDQSSLFDWSVRSSFSDTSRAEYNSMRTASLDLNNNLDINKFISINGLASHSITTVAGNSGLSNSLKYSQVGIGAKWTTPKGSVLSLNIINANSQRSPNEVYLGGSLLLNLSPHSSVSITKKKNALGESNAFAINIRGKYYSFRSSYDNTIDISTRFTTASSDAQLFLCPIGLNDISQCFLNTGIDTVDQSSYFETSFSDSAVELNEQITHKESLSAHLAFDNTKRIKVSTTLTYSENVNLEAEQAPQKSLLFSYTAAYVLSSNSNISVNFRRNKLSQISSNASNTQKQMDLTYKKSLGKRTNWTVFTKDIDITRNSESVSELQIGSKITISFN